MEKDGLYYGLEDNPGGAKTWIYAFQFLTFAVANAAVIPVIVGLALGLHGAEIASLVQRTFFVSSIASLLQALWGHRYPIFEGPAGMWYSVFIVLGSLAPAMGKPLAVLRTDLEFGLLVAGVITMIIGATGLMAKITKLFSPVVNGVFLTVMALQLSTSIVQGMLGITSEKALSLKAIVVATLTVVTTVYFALGKKSFLNTISILLGTMVGWAVARIIGLQPLETFHVAGVITFPSLLAWGAPTYDFGITLTCILAGLIVLSNLVASLLSMGELTGCPADARRLNRGALFTGVSDLLAGTASVVGFIPYASSIGLVSVSRVAARIPFMVGSLVLALLSLFPLIGYTFASIPPAVGYSVLLVTFSQIVVMAMKNFAQTGYDPRSNFIFGISVMLGVGLMSVPQTYLSGLPVWSRYLLSNGLIVATVLSLVLENLVLRCARATS